MWARSGFYQAILHLFTKIHLALEQGIDHFHQSRNRTMIVFQAIQAPLFGLHIGPGLVIGQHITAAETINGLFWITDHNHAALLIIAGMTQILASILS